MTHRVSQRYLAQHFKGDGERGGARMFQKLLCNPAPTFLQGHACLKHVCVVHVSHHLLHHYGSGIITDARPVPRVWSVHQPAG